MERGKHIIRAANRRASTPPPPAPSRSRYWGVALLALGALLVMLLSGCGRKEPPAIYTLDSIVTQQPVRPDAPASAPTPPQPPRAKVALIQAADPPTNAEPIVVALGGGNYNITYETADRVPDLRALGTQNVFFADYNRNITMGDPHSAEIYVLVGSLKLQIGDIAESDSLYTSILTRGKNVNAYFNFSISERGPPNAGTARRVIVVGEMESIGLPERHGTSGATVDYLDLDPSEESQKAYEAAMAKYKMDVLVHRAAVVEGNVDPPSRLEPNSPIRPEPHPYHPPTYHPPVRARP